MLSPDTIKQKLEDAFDDRQATVLAEVVWESYENRGKKEDFSELKAIVSNLADAQERTEQRLGRLADAVHDLTIEHGKTRKQLGGLSMTVGYTLEDKAYKALPRLLERDYNIQITGRLFRKYMTIETGRTLEVNILGEAVQDDRPLVIAGESKSQLSKKHIDVFLKKVIRRLKPLYPDIFPIMVT